MGGVVCGNPESATAICDIYDEEIARISTFLSVGRNGLELLNRTQKCERRLQI